MNWVYIRFFIKVFNETVVNINNELNSSDGYRSINYIGCWQSLYMNPFMVHSCCRPVKFTLR